MLKKILIAALVIVVTRFIVFLFIDGKGSTKLSQEKADSIVLETEKMSPDKLEEILKKNENINIKFSQQDLEKFVISKNKFYPKTNANGIRIDKLTTSLGLITYHKTITNLTIDEFDSSQHNMNSIRNNFINEVCSSSATRNIINSGISIQNIYRDKNSILISDNIVRPADCKI